MVAEDKEATCRLLFEELEKAISLFWGAGAGWWLGRSLTVALDMDELAGADAGAAHRTCAIHTETLEDTAGAENPLTTWGVYDIGGCVVAYGAEFWTLVFECAEAVAECLELCFGAFFGPA